MKSRSLVIGLVLLCVGCGDTGQSKRAQELQAELDKREELLSEYKVKLRDLEEEVGQLAKKVDHADKVISDQDKQIADFETRKGHTPPAPRQETVAVAAKVPEPVKEEARPVPPPVKAAAGPPEAAILAEAEKAALSAVETRAATGTRTEAKAAPKTGAGPEAKVEVKAELKVAPKAEIPVSAKAVEPAVTQAPAKVEKVEPAKTTAKTATQAGTPAVETAEPETEPEDAVMAATPAPEEAKAEIKITKVVPAVTPKALPADLQKTGAAAEAEEAEPGVAEEAPEESEPAPESARTAPATAPIAESEPATELRGDGLRQRVAQLIGRIGSEERAEQKRAEKDLIAIGPAAVPLVRKSLQTQNKDVAWRLRAVLAVIGTEKVERPAVPAARTKEKKPIPLLHVVRTEPETAPAAPMSPPDPEAVPPGDGEYSLRVVTYSVSSDVLADRVVNDLRAKGFRAFKKAQGSYIFVYVGRMKSPRSEEALKLKREIAHLEYGGKMPFTDCHFTKAGF